MSSALKAKVKNAANLLQQRKLLQRNLRSLQQHSLSRDILAAYRNRMHALPPPEALRSMTPYMNERMRKRRCFADKDLEMVMLERERQLEIAKSRAAPITQSQLSGLHAGNGPSPLLAKTRMLPGNLNHREFLQRIFPGHNPNVLELVWQGCGGSLEQAIEQLASGIKPTSAPVPATAAAGAPASPASMQGSQAHPMLPLNHPQQQQNYLHYQQQQQQQLHHHHQQQLCFQAGMLGFTAQLGLPVSPGVVAVRPPQSVGDPRMEMLSYSSHHPSLCVLPFPFLPSVPPAVFSSLPRPAAGNSSSAETPPLSGPPTSSSEHLLRSMKTCHPWFSNRAPPASSAEVRKSAFKSCSSSAEKDRGVSLTQDRGLNLTQTSSDHCSVSTERSSASPYPHTSPSRQSSSPHTPPSSQSFQSSASSQSPSTRTPASSRSRSSSSSEDISESEPAVHVDMSEQTAGRGRRGCVTTGSALTGRGPVEHVNTPVKAKLKFSVESIIGNA
ncbi:hypothetical protein ACOMHN_058070 [Nucella lapillus]